MVMIIRRNFLLNKSDLLVALSLFVFVISALCYVETFLKESKGQIKFGFLAVLNGNELVDTYQVFWDVSCNAIKHALDSLL
jgi:hypothetical protein